MIDATMAEQTAERRRFGTMPSELRRLSIWLQQQGVEEAVMIECLWEEMRIQLSMVVSDLLGVSGLRILHALAQGESDPQQLAQLGDKRLQCSEEPLVDALTGRAQPMYREMLALQLERPRMIDTQIVKLNGLIAQAMKPHQDAVIAPGGSAWIGSGFGAAGDFGSGRAGRYISMGSGVDLVGGNLP